jgi:hypothetical protein
MILRLSFALLALTGAAAAQSRYPDPVPTPEGYSTPAFEMFKLAPGKTEEFIRGVAIWDQVNAAGGQPKTHLYLHDDGEGWDVMLYKPPRAKPTPEQIAAMTKKRIELGLPTGPMYFIALREKVADHAHVVMTGPMLAESWVAELDKQRADLKAGKK